LQDDNLSHIINFSARKHVNCFLYMTSVSSSQSKNNNYVLRSVSLYRRRQKRNSN